MSVISRQFAKDILLSTIFVLIVLIALFAFFDLIGQLDDVGADYTIGRAFLTTSLTLPSRAYEVMPLAVLLASVYTMSKWASTSEFTVLRASGCSPWRLARSLLIPGVICVLATYGLGEIVAPAAQRFAQEVREPMHHCRSADLHLVLGSETLLIRPRTVGLNAISTYATSLPLIGS